jgi:hypothetical protein
VAVPAVPPDDCEVTTWPAGCARGGHLCAARPPDRDPALDCSLDGALELARRDEEEHGLGDLPYPPEYPKMAGEPKRVQPSRDKDRKRA